MESEKPLSLGAFIGCVLSVMSLFVAFILNRTVFEQTAIPLASLSALILLVIGIVLMYAGSKK